MLGLSVYVLLALAADAVLDLSDEVTSVARQQDSDSSRS